MSRNQVRNALASLTATGLIQSSQARVHREHDGLDDSLTRHGRVLTAIRHRDAAAAEHAAREMLHRTAIDLVAETTEPLTGQSIPGE